MHDKLKQALELAISEATHREFRIEGRQVQGGGCINDAFILSGRRTSYFVKLNAADRLDMFEAEAAALRALAAASALRVPEPISCGLAAGQSYLILEALRFGSPKAGSWQTMGCQLARLHRNSHEQFGWHHDNHIGSTPQHNQWAADWAAFFREQRLRPQLERARRNGYHFKRADELLDAIEELLAGHSPTPALLHGDLWSGNASFLDDGCPVIYDPATYYGDRETDLAFSEFFGGFPHEFYQAYAEEWPLDSGYESRKTLYNLYHVLNHANLFGGGYAGQAERMITQLLT